MSEPIQENPNKEEESEEEEWRPQVPEDAGPGYSVIHRGQRPTPKPMPEPVAVPTMDKAKANKPPVSSRPPRGGVHDPEKSVMSNAPSVASRASSLSKKSHLLKSDILSKEEEARLLKEKRDKMDAIKQKYSRRSR